MNTTGFQVVAATDTDDPPTGLFHVEETVRCTGPANDDCWERLPA